MTDTQLYLAIGVPIIAIMLGMLFNHIRIGDVHTRINDMRDLLRAEIQTSREQTRADTAELKGEMGELKTMLKVLMGKVDEMDTRLTRVEERLTGR